jgi:hypothetical protein
VTPQDFAVALDDGIGAFTRNLRLFVAAAHELGIAVIVPQLVYQSPRSGRDSAAVALWSRALGWAPPQVVWGGFAQLDSAARASTLRLGAQHVLASDSALWAFENFADGDPVHFSDRGALRFAEHLSRFITASEAKWSKKRRL